MEILQGDNLTLLPTLESESFRFIYVDPPFNTHIRRQRGALGYADTYEDYLGFLLPRLEEAYRLLTPDGSLFVHLDTRESHYVKVALDKLFGRESFINEIIWSYDYGGRSKRRWSSKHDTILWYAKNPKDYIFNYDLIDRIPYMAPDLCGPEKAAKGKTPTDVWWMTIVPTNSKEKTGYPTQKPIRLLNRLLTVHTKPGDRVLDFFAGSGTTGIAALKVGCHPVLIDQNPQAIEVMKKRFDYDQQDCRLQSPTGLAQRGCKPIKEETR